MYCSDRSGCFVSGSRAISNIATYGIPILLYNTFRYCYYNLFIRSCQSYFCYDYAYIKDRDAFNNYNFSVLDYITILTTISFSLSASFIGLLIKTRSIFLGLCLNDGWTLILLVALAGAHKADIGERAGNKSRH